ncbi:MAG: hypothetical protein CL878_05530 [Dehalococcoidia bacterium]|nr:hypothetical protein [Dehalococcoidia bacterium]
MRYDPSSAESWFAWFLDPHNTDRAKLRAALRSVPPGSTWHFVDGRLCAALQEGLPAGVVPMVMRTSEKAPILWGGVGVSEAELVETDGLVMKGDLVVAERSRRGD